MFSLKDNIGEEINNLRQELRLKKTELSKLSGVSVKAIYNLEKGRSKGKIETFVRIRDAVMENFSTDLFDKIGIKIVWELKDFGQEGLNIIEGGLLGDGCIAKYGVYRQEAKDKKYLEWLGKLLNESGVKCKVIPIENKSSYSKNKTFYLLYTHSCPAFFELRKRWYIRKNDEEKETKTIPADIKLTSTTLLHWYLGDGNFKRDDRKFPRGGRPTIRLFTNDFLRGDIKLLLYKLKTDLGLNFYASPKLNRNTEKGYVLYFYPTDLFKFFKIIIGLEPPKEIKDGVIEIRKGIPHTFKEKWPNEYDWVKILAKTEGTGKLLQKRRKELGLTQRDLAEKIDSKKHHISEIECGRKRMSLGSFTEILKALKLEKDLLVTDLIEQIPNVLRKSA